MCTLYSCHGSHFQVLLYFNLSCLLAGLEIVHHTVAAPFGHLKICCFCHIKQSGGTDSPREMHKFMGALEVSLCSGHAILRRNYRFKLFTIWADNVKEAHIGSTLKKKLGYLATYPDWHIGSLAKKLSWILILSWSIERSVG